MYKAEIDNLMLFQTDVLNGMRYVENPVLNLAVSSVESFQFTIYPGHRLYDKIGCMKSLVKVWQDEKLIFYGRITGYSEEMYGVKTYDCEGAMTWLNDEVLSHYSMSGMTPENALRNYISMYNQKITDPSHKFSVGKVTVFKTTESGKDGVIHRASALRPSFWNEISEKLIQPLGGFLRIQYKAEKECAGVIDWLVVPNETCTQEVQYAKNLMGCDRKIDGTTIITAVVPLGGSKGESGGEEVRETISQLDDLNATAILHSFLSDDLEKSGDMIYSKSGVQEYGFIKRTITWDDTDAGTLLFSAGEWLLQNGKAESTIDVEAIDAADIDGDVSHFQCGNYVKVRLPGEKSTMIFPITAIEIPISNPESGRLFVGAQTYGIADTGKSGTAGGYSESGGVTSSHTHANKTILDAIEEPYTTEEKEKLACLENYVHPAHASYSSGFYKITADALGHITNAEPVVKSDITALGIPGKDTVYTGGKSDYGDIYIDDNFVISIANAVGMRTNSNLTSEIFNDYANNTVAGMYSRAFGTGCHTSGNWASSGGALSYALGDGSFAYGYGIRTSGYCQTAFGQYNENGNYIFEIGNGTSDIKRINAFAVDAKGNVFAQGDVTAVNFVGANATQSAQGLMSADDKAKLDGIETGATKTVVDTALSATSTNPVQNMAVKAALDKTYQLRGGVTASTDWNTITQAGCYKVQIPSWGDADTCHSPNSYDASLYSFGLLFVMASEVESEHRVSQVYIPHRASPKIVTRMHNGSEFASGWQSWSSPACTPLSHTHSQYYDSSLSRTANTVLAAPNGSAGGATFRELVAADIPDLSDKYLPLSKVLKGSSGTDSWETVPQIGSDGVMEVGKYIDFHIADGSTVDYDVRITADANGIGVTKRGSSMAIVNAIATYAKQLQTARTLKIGNTGKTFDGSADVEWTLSDIGASAIGHTHTSITPYVTVGSIASALEYRLAATISVKIWSHYFGVYAIGSRHAGTGILVVELGCENGTVSYENVKAQCLYYGSDISGRISTDSYRIHVSADGTTAYFFVRNYDYSQVPFRLLHESGGMSISNGTSMASIDTSVYGTKKCGTTIIGARYCEDTGWIDAKLSGYASSGTIQYRIIGKQITVYGDSVVLAKDVAVTPRAPQALATCTNDFSNIKGCCGVGKFGTRSAIIRLERYDTDNLIGIFSTEEIPAGTTGWFSVTGFID